MNADETTELIAELEALRHRLSELSEAIADCHARRLTQESLIGRLREQLRTARATTGNDRRT